MKVPLVITLDLENLLEEEGKIDARDKQAEIKR